MDAVATEQAAKKEPRKSESGGNGERRYSNTARRPQQQRRSSSNANSDLNWRAREPSGGAVAEADKKDDKDVKEKQPATRRQSNGNSKSRSRTNSQNNATAPEKNNRNRSNSSAKSNEGGRNNRSSKPRSNSQVNGNESGEEKVNGKARNASSSSKRRLTKGSSNSINSNGDGYPLDDDYDLDEPFSDSDDDTVRPTGPRKMCLNIPRGRIRTLSGTVPIVGYSPKWGGPTMCLSCLEFFDLPDMVEDFSNHLLNEHKIVVSEMELIVDPKRYVEHWRQRFAKESIDKIFPRIEIKEGDPLHGKVEYYFKMSEAIPEDYSLRQRLAMRRLEEALACQHREREDANFSLQCIFCRYTARGNRSKIIHHLYMIHHLNLGSPDNLVFVTEYIEHLKEKLNRNECIFCEKLFGDRNTLMDHMRKRNHREVNPKNNYYDKFYIINYLELGKRWLDVLAEDFEDTMPTFVDSDEEEEEDSWHEWQEDNLDEDQTRVVCLFCDESHETAEASLQHKVEAHNFDLLKIIETEKLDVYGRVKLINYIRKQNFHGICFVCGASDLGGVLGIRKHQAENDHLSTLPDRALWDTEEFLVPMYGNDHLLWMLESFLDEKEIKAKEGRSLPTDFKLALIQESEENTVDGVFAEDLPELVEDSELRELLK